MTDLSVYQAEAWFLLGCVLLVVDMALFGFASGVLLFVGIGGIVTGALMYFGLVPETLIAGLASLALASAASAALLWKPLKNLQNSGEKPRSPMSDLVGYEFRLDSMVTPDQPGKTRYSGIDWDVEISPQAGGIELQAGTRVQVVSVDAGVFRVMPV